METHHNYLDDTEYMFVSPKSQEAADSQRKDRVQVLLHNARQALANAEAVDRPRDPAEEIEFARAYAAAAQAEAIAAIANKIDLFLANQQLSVSTLRHIINTTFAND